MREAIENKTHYNTILVDAYNGTSIPEELVTKEFFADLQLVGEHIMLNMILDKNFTSNFSKHVLATLDAARPEVRYRNVSTEDGGAIGNFLITSKPFSGAVHYKSE